MFDNGFNDSFDGSSGFGFGQDDGGFTYTADSIGQQERMLGALPGSLRNSSSLSDDSMMHFKDNRVQDDEIAEEFAAMAAQGGGYVSLKATIMIFGGLIALMTAFAGVMTLLV